MKNWVVGIIIIILLVIMGFWAGYHTHRLEWLQILFVLFSLYGIFMVLNATVRDYPKFCTNSKYAPFVSFIIPARNEEAVIARTIRSIMGLNYFKDGKPNFEVIVMDDNSSDRTGDVARSLMVEYPNLKVVHRDAKIAGKGKADVLNHGMKIASGEIIGVIDADTFVDPDFLKVSIPYLADPKVGAIQGRVRLYNYDKNILTNLQEDEFAVVSHLYQLGKEHLGGLTALGGNGQLVKKKALEDVDGWNYLSPTEDLDLTFRLVFAGWDIRYVPKAVLWQEGVERLVPFLRQRIRWAEGFLKCMFDYIPSLILKRVPLTKKIDGTLTMGRILLPFFLLIGYTYAILSLLHKIQFFSVIPASIFSGLTVLYLSTFSVAMLKERHSNILIALARAYLYSLYGSFWIIVIPIGFVNCIRRINDIYWDKTVHTGSTSDKKVKSRFTEYTREAVS